jgi:hypothetical protein
MTRRPLAIPAEASIQPALQIAAMGVTDIHERRLRSGVQSEYAARVLDEQPVELSLAEPLVGAARRELVEEPAERHPRVDLVGFLGGDGPRPRLKGARTYNPAPCARPRPGVMQVSRSTRPRLAAIAIGSIRHRRGVAEEV